MIRLSHDISLSLGGSRWTLGLLVGRAWAVAEGLNHKPVLIQTAHGVRALELVIAAFIKGVVPILDPKKVLAEDHQYQVPQLPPLTGDFSLLSSRELSPCPQQKIGFTTSGSTGAPKVILRSLEGLVREAHSWAQNKIVDSSECMVSLVSPVHIYGFIHSFLVPAMKGINVEYLEALDLGARFESCDVLLMVPAQWSSVARYLADYKVGLLVSSGAPFGRHRQDELRTRLFHQCSEAVEILGSTETGGLGYRNLLEDSESFAFFSGVHIHNSDRGSRLDSDYAPELEGFFLQDRLLPTEGGGFIHGGRLDRTFKYSGQRFDLSAIESALVKLKSVWDSRCYFQEDDTLAKGGRLVAWLCSNDLADESEFRKRYKRLTSLPCPDRLFVVDKIPTDSNGKVAMMPLLAMLGP